MVTQQFTDSMEAHVIEHKKVENTAVLAATNFFSPAITPSKTPCKLIIYIAMSAAGKLDLFRNGLATGERLNDDVALVANAPYRFVSDLARADNSINLQYSAGATINYVYVKEVPDNGE